MGKARVAFSQRVNSSAFVIKLLDGEHQNSHRICHAGMRVKIEKAHVEIIRAWVLSQAHYTPLCDLRGSDPMKRERSLTMPKAGLWSTRIHRPPCPYTGHRTDHGRRGRSETSRIWLYGRRSRRTLKSQ